MGRHLELRQGIYQYRRRVPTDIADLDRRGEVRRSTKARTLAEALVVAARIDAELEAYWGALAERGGSGAVSAEAERFDRAVRLARAMGLSYRPAGEIAAGEFSDIMRRVDALEKRDAAASPQAVQAALGGAARPSIVVSQLFGAYEAHVRDVLLGKSPDQVRKWRNPRLRAASNLAAVVGDKALTDVSRDDALEFRTWWLDRVVEDGYDPGSANKDLQHLSTMFSTLAGAWRLQSDDPFAGLRLAGERHNPRTAYAADYVRDEILPGHRLASLNPEARAIVQLVAATGMRPSELASLTAERIVLEANIPHLQVRADGRQLKSDAAARDMPLTGIALEVMREHRGGFPRYRAVPDSFSAVANKALDSCGLRPTPAHTVYSLRHTFKDRLIAIEAPPRVQDALMGHAVGEIKYGAGPSLEQRAEWIARVWG